MNRRVLARIGDLVRARAGVVEGPVLEIGVIRKESAVHQLPGLLDRPAVVVDLSRADRPDVQADARGLPFAEGTFGVVVCTNVLEHVPDWWTVLGELYRVLAGSGLLIVSVPGYRQASTVRLGALPGLRGSVAPTFGVHRAPGDFYRFGRDAMEGIVLAGCYASELDAVKLAPTFIAMGLKDPNGWRSALASVGVPA